MSHTVERTALRLNVSCSSRSKKFLVLGEKDNTVSEFLTAIQEMFHKLYPNEPSLKISGVKNHDGFDIFLDYKLGDLFEDNACLSVMESDVSGKEGNDLNESTSSGFHEEQSTMSDGDSKEHQLKETKDASPDLDKINKPKDGEAANKKNVEDQEKVPSGLSPSENKRSHLESDEQKKKRHKNAKKKKTGK